MQWRRESDGERERDKGGGGNLGAKGLGRLKPRGARTLVEWTGQTERMGDKQNRKGPKKGNFKRICISIDLKESENS